MYKTFLKSPTPFNESSYKRYRNKLNHSLRLAKRPYQEAKMESLTANIKGTWNILNQIINGTKCPNKLPNSLRINTAAGHDKVPMWSVKESIYYISEPLTYVINLSI